MEQLHVLEKLVEDGLLGQALEKIETLSPSEQQDWQVLNLKGIIYSYRSQYKQAADSFRAALGQQPEALDVLFNLAEVSFELNQMGEAETLLRRCEQLPGAEEMAEEIGHLRNIINNPKRVLMIVYDFPPLALSGTSRILLGLAQRLPAHGWKPTVISTDQLPAGWDQGENSSPMQDAVERITVPDRIGTGRETEINKARALSILYFLRKILRYSEKADSIAAQNKKPARGLIELLTFPCNALSWAYDTVKYLEEEMDLSQFQAIYTVSGPASAHLVGYYLSQTRGIPWVAHYESPLTENPHGGDGLLAELEGLFISQSARNVTTSEKQFPYAFHMVRLQGDGQLADILNTVQSQQTDIREIPASPYDNMYQSDGVGTIYRSHYTKSHYFHAWQQAMAYLCFQDRSIRILEIGCGPGQFANMLFDHGFTNYIGFDYSAEAVTLAKRNNPAYALQFTVADAFQTPLLDEQYDFVICFEVLEHLQNDIGLLRRIRPGTKILLSVPDFDDPYHIRFFPSEKAVCERYQSEIHILGTSFYTLQPSYDLFYLAGEKR